MKNQFFISYSSQDTKFVENLETSLREAGIPTWVDRGRLSAGETWTESIPLALEKSLAVILVISPDAIGSKWVRKETLLACRNNKRIIPIIYRSTKIPPAFEFLVGEYQHLDFTDKSYEDGIRDLVDAIRQHDASASTIDEKASTEFSTFTYYVEDVVELLSHVPRLMLWRILSLNDLPLLERVYRIYLIRPPGLLADWALTFAFSVLFSLLLFAVTSTELIIWTLFIFMAAFSAASILIIGVPLRRWLKRSLFKLVAGIWQELPYRPDQKSSNKLLDRWHNPIKRILWQLLNDKSGGPTLEDISKRCPDSDLAARVETILRILLSLGL